MEALPLKKEAAQTFVAWSISLSLCATIPAPQYNAQRTAIPTPQYVWGQRHGARDRVIDIGLGA
eukprot:2996459-Rhodomonas_salina.1